LSLKDVQPGDKFQFERLGLFLRRPRFHGGAAGFQPHGTPEGYLAKLQKK